jgi:uncharacterized protein
LIERYDISHPKAVADLAHWLADNTASFYSINRLTHYLQSLTHKVHKSLITNYLASFEDAYFFFSVRLFDASLSRSKSNPKKHYCIDHAFVVSVSSGILFNTGHLLENLVFITLRRTVSEIFYYKTKTGKEVDFIFKMNDHVWMLVQVCESLAVMETRQREITALVDAMAELNIQSSILVTRNEEEVIVINNTKIQVTPAWRFLLNKLQLS